MKRWTRAERDCLCGRCGEPIQAAEPVLAIAITGVKRPIMRCQRCVGEPPPSLPAQLERAVREPARLLSFKALADQVSVQDWKVRQAGEGE